MSDLKLEVVDEEEILIYQDGNKRMSERLDKVQLSYSVDQPGSGGRAGIERITKWRRKEAGWLRIKKRLDWVKRRFDMNEKNYIQRMCNKLRGRAFTRAMRTLNRVMASKVVNSAMNGEDNMC